MAETTSITIRDVPTDVRNELGARAARSGRSLQAYLLEELTTLASRPSVSDWLAEVRDRKRRYPHSVSTDDILAWRDADRR